MAAGVTKTLWSLTDIIEDWEAHNKPMLADRLVG